MEKAEIAYSVLFEGNALFQPWWYDFGPSLFWLLVY